MAEPKPPPAERSDPMQRLLNLLTLLLNARQPVTFETIDRELGSYAGSSEARRQSFERDKRALRELGARIITEPVDYPVGSSGYRIDPDEFYLPVLELSEAERLALQLAMTTVTVAGSWGAGAALKLGGLESEAVQPLTSIAASEILPMLYEAARVRQSVTMTYQPVGKPATRREVDPYGVLLRRGVWYLVGWCHLRSAMRTFRVDRIDPATLLLGAAGSFEVPADFDLAGALNDNALRFGDGELHRVVVRIDADRAWWVERDRGSHTVIERFADGSIAIEVEMNHWPALRHWVLGFRGHAEVLSPPEYRELMVQWLDAIATTSGHGAK